jgi:hypothetical protein
MMTLTSTLRKWSTSGNPQAADRVAAEIRDMSVADIIARIRTCAPEQRRYWQERLAVKRQETTV